MATFAGPRRGYCASCDGLITDTPVYKMDEAYCCLGCADGGPCICLYEADLADDGVDHIGLPFAMPEGEPVVQPTGVEAPSRDRPTREVVAR